MFSKAIVKTPSSAVVNGITSSQLGTPIYEKALSQHEEYIDALKDCKVKVICLDPDEDYPDSCFVEDTALLTSRCAIITNPGAESRKGEPKHIKKELKQHYKNIEQIQPPGTIEAGDIMMVGNHFYIGLSARTNESGADQMISYLSKYGFTGSKIELKEVLHLKTGMSYLEHNNLLISGEFVNHPYFKEFNKIIIDPKEAYSANCIWVNDTVIIPSGFPKTLKQVHELGYRTIEVDVSEFEKIDGGLSCLSLRF